MAIKRQCGYRIDGGVYFTCPKSDDGEEIEYFLVDPPHPFYQGAMGCTSHGVYAIQHPKTGVYHVYDIIGQDNYPNVYDIIEEAKGGRGISRRGTLPNYAMLTSQSRLVLVHPKAIIKNWRDYLPHFTDHEKKWFRCPKGKHDIESLNEQCIEMCRHDGTHGLYPQSITEDWGVRAGHLRKLECGIEYSIWPQPDEVIPQYQHGIIAVFPLKIEVVRDKAGNSHDAQLQKVRRSKGIEIELVED